MKKNKVDITKFNIFHDNVLIEALDVSEKDGIIRPRLYEDKPEIGTVISVGEGRMLESGKLAPMPIKKGNTVIFNKYSSTKINLDGKDFYIVRAEDVVGSI